MNLWLDGQIRIVDGKADFFLSFTAEPENGYQDYKTIPGCLPPSHESSFVSIQIL